MVMDEISHSISFNTNTNDWKIVFYLWMRSKGVKWEQMMITVHEIEQSIFTVYEQERIIFTVHKWKWTILQYAHITSRVTRLGKI